jgi:diaminopimelate decarboxylase
MLIKGLQLAEQFGSPLYVYDAEKNTIVQPIDKAFSKVEKLRINYAMKAYPNVIMQLLKWVRIRCKYPFKSTIGSTCRI